MKRRWSYVALVSLGCLGPRDACAQSAEHAPDTMEARVMACAPCHGAKGEGTNNEYFPRLAGKPAGYLANQLRAFHTGRRHYPPMNYLLAYLPEDYLRQIAEYFAAQRPPLPTPAVPAVSKDVLERGESIVSHGDAANHIPACSSCHGPHFTGMEPAVPGLLGLRPMSRREGRGDNQRLFPAPRRQTRRLSCQSAPRFPHWTPTLSADELPSRLSSRRLPKADRGIFRRTAPSAANTGGSYGQQRRARAGRVHRCAWRRGQQHTCLFELSWSPSYGHGAGHSRPFGLARELYQRPAGRMALRHAHRSGARLHADCRRSPDGGRRQGDRRLSRFAAGAAGSFACASRHFHFAFCLRE